MEGRLFTPEEKDIQWIQCLGRTASGREFEEHVSNLDYSFRNRGRAECSVQQVADFRRVFCLAFEENAQCFGLPAITPKYIAIANLSGKRRLYYSNNAAMIRLLCNTGQEMAQRVIENVQIVMDHAEQSNSSVLLCVSLPWQSGITHAFWEARTIRRMADGKVRDGEQCFSMTFDGGPRTVCSSNQTMNEDIRVLRAQIEAFAQNIPTVNLDLSADALRETSNEVSAAKKCERLEGIVDALKESRQKVIDEMNAMRIRHDDELKEAARKGDERVGKVADASRRSDELVKKKMAEVEAMNSTLVSQVKDLTAKNRTLAAEKAEQDLLFSSERQKLDTAAKLSAAESKSASERLNAETKAIDRERRQLSELHARNVTDLERRLNESTISERKALQRAQEHYDTIGRLEQVVDQLRTEKQACAFDSIRHQTSNRKLRSMIAVAMLSMRMRRQELDSVSTELKDVRGKLQGYEIKQMIDTGETRSAADVSVNTEPMQDSEELCNLRAEVARCNAECEEARLLIIELTGKNIALQKRNDQMVHTEEEMRREVARLKKKRPPKGLLPNGEEGAPSPTLEPIRVANPSPVPASTPTSPVPPDMTVEATGDPSLDALIANAHRAVKSLSDIARQSATHRRNAETFCAELGVFRQMAMNGWHADPHAFTMQQQQQPFQYHAGFNGNGALQKRQQWVPGYGEC